MALGEDWLKNGDWNDLLGRGIVHGMLLRRPGAPKGRRALSLSVGEAEESFRGLLAEFSSRADQADSVTVVSGDQVHEDRVVVIEGTESFARSTRVEIPGDVFGEAYEFPETDALITTQPNVLLLIQTADCLPILFCDAERGLIGACHCGWRGLRAGLGRKTAESLIGLGAEAGRLRAWIAPGIGVANYEVSAEMVDDFRGEFPGLDLSPDGRHLNLDAVAQRQLADAGLAPENVTSSGLCTFAEAKWFHSYRRDGAHAGRMLTVIGRFE